MLNSCTVLSFVSNFRIVSKKESFKSKEVSTLISDNIVVFSCAKDATTSTEPSKISRVWRSESCQSLQLTIVADCVRKMMTTCHVTCQIVRLENCIVGALRQTWIVDVEILKNNIVNEGFSIETFLFTNNIEIFSEDSANNLTIDGNGKHSNTTTTTA